MIHSYRKDDANCAFQTDYFHFFIVLLLFGEDVSKMIRYCFGCVRHARHGSDKNAHEMGDTQFNYAENITFAIDLVFVFIFISFAAAISGVM